MVNRLDKISSCQPSTAWWQKLQLYLSPIHASHISCASLGCCGQNTQEKDHPQAIRKSHPKNQRKTPARFDQKDLLGCRAYLCTILHYHSIWGIGKSMLQRVKNGSLPPNICSLCVGKTSKTHKLKRTTDSGKGLISQELAMLNLAVLN